MLSTPSRLPLLAALAAVALVPLTGCGGDEQAASTVGQGLAHLAPPASIFYGEAAVQPTGKAKVDLDALISDFAPGESSQKLLARLTTDTKGRWSFKRDVEPWLGKHVGVAVTRLPASSRATPGLALLAETTDGAKAFAALRRSPKGKLSEREYGGTKYLFDDGDDTAGALVGRTLVVGTVPALKSIIDTAKTGNGLGDQERYKHVVDAVDDDAIATAYGDVSRLFGALMGLSAASVDRRQLKAADKIVEQQGFKTIAAGIVVQDKALKLRVASVSKLKDYGDGGSAQLAATPEGSWAAAGVSQLGKVVGTNLDQVRAITGSGYDVGAALEAFRRKTDIDVEKDLLPWMGDAGLFVRGTSVTDLGGALVVESTDPGATRAVLGKAKGVALKAGMRPRILTAKGVDDGFSARPKGLPVEVFVALAGKRFVIAANRSALDEALDPRTRLGDDPAYKAAVAQLGDGVKPGLFIDVPKVTGLIGLAADDKAAFAKAKTKLDKVKTIIAGGRHVGDMRVLTVSVGLR